MPRLSKKTKQKQKLKPVQRLKLPGPAWFNRYFGCLLNILRKHFMKTQELAYELAHDAAIKVMKDLSTAVNELTKQQAQDLVFRLIDPLIEQDQDDNKSWVDICVDNTRRRIRFYNFLKSIDQQENAAFSDVTYGDLRALSTKTKRQIEYVKNDYTIGHEAARKGHVHVMKWLEDNGYRHLLLATNKEGRMPIDEAHKYNRSEAKEYLSDLAVRVASE